MCCEGQLTVLSPSQYIHNEYWVISMNFEKKMHLECQLTVFGLTQYIYNKCWTTDLSLTQYMPN